MFSCHALFADPGMILGADSIGKQAENKSIFSREEECRVRDEKCGLECLS